MKTLRLPIASDKLISMNSGKLTEDIRPVNKFYISRLKFDLWNPKPFDKVEYYNGDEIITMNLESITVKGDSYIIKVNKE